MKRRIALFLVVILMATCFCACESKAVGEARTAFLEGRYADVIQLQKNKSVMDNEEMLRIWKLSSAAEAYSAGDYQKCLDNLYGLDLSQELYFADLSLFSEAFLEYNQENFENVVNMLSDRNLRDDQNVMDIYGYSCAYLAYQNGDYQAVLDSLGYNLHFAEDEIIKKSWREVMMHSISEKEFSTFVEYMNRENAPCELVFSLLTDVCDDFNYNAFLLLDAWIEGAENETIKGKLEAYASENLKTRTKAFLKGTWELQSIDADKTTVKISVDNDDAQCVGIVTHVGADERQYKFFTGEIYWKEFIFEDGVIVSMFNQAKTQYGDAVGLNASVNLFFETNTLNIQLPKKSTSGIRVVNRDRTWVKISLE